MADDPIVYEIDLSKKYVLSFPTQLTHGEFARIKHEIDEWLKSDQPFLLIDKNVRLVRVETADQPSPPTPLPEGEGRKSEE